MQKITKQINLESLDQAIKDFNDWNKTARIYYNKEDGTFETEVYLNDVQAAQTFNNNDNVIALYSKKESKRTPAIGKYHKEYLIGFADLLNKGYDAHEAEYHLS